MTTKSTTTLKFEDIAKVEPRLNLLHEDMKRLARTSPTRELKERGWYLLYKPKMSELVGYASTSSGLRRADVYDTVYQKFINILKI